jgi:hypothetical protein
MQKTFNVLPLKLDQVYCGLSRCCWAVEDDAMTDQDRINSAMREAHAILSEYSKPGQIRNPNATVNKLVAVLDRPELATALERLEHASGGRVLQLVK